MVGIYRVERDNNSLFKMEILDEDTLMDLNNDLNKDVVGVWPLWMSIGLPIAAICLFILTIIVVYIMPNRNVLVAWNKHQARKV